jgi:rubredoxin
MTLLVIQYGGKYMFIREWPMREFKCSECGYIWERSFGDGVRGMDLECPECGSVFIHRRGKQGRGCSGRERGNGRRGVKHGRVKHQSSNIED